MDCTLLEPAAAMKAMVAIGPREGKAETEQALTARTLPVNQEDGEKAEHCAKKTEQNFSA